MRIVIFYAKGCSFLGFCDLVAGEPEASLARLIIYDGLAEICFLEIGPVFRGKIEFGICDFPKEEIGNAEVAASADKQVGVGHAGSCKAT